jgi:hypothetical protein
MGTETHVALGWLVLFFPTKQLPHTEPSQAQVRALMGFCWDVKGAARVNFGMLVLLSRHPCTKVPSDKKGASASAEDHRHSCCIR